MRKYIFVGLFFFSIVGTGIKYAYDTISGLKNELIKVKATNKSLLQKQENIKKKIRERRNLITTKKLNKAKIKIAKAPASMVPVAGAAVVVGLTVYEIQAFCEEIKEYKKFEQSLFGDIEDTISEDEKLLCGLDIQESLINELKKYNNF